MFWDGRATGWTLGDPLAEQALGPFLNPLEQNMASAEAVCVAVAASDYCRLVRGSLGGSIDSKANVISCTNRIGRSISAYERSAEVNPFTSRYDFYLAGKAKFTGQEERGLKLFEGKGKCSACHPAPLFTDFTYDNLGVPKNPLNPFYSHAVEVQSRGENWVDPGLGGFLASAGYSEEVYLAEWGKHKVPTLRNVDLRPNKRLCQSVRPQRLLQVAGGNRALL